MIGGGPAVTDDGVFKVGDTVTLKSGGHLMTVASVDEGSVTCDWSLRGDIKSKSFPAAELQKADGTVSPISINIVRYAEPGENESTE
jgi:uncharacterized protein YodC (DUF2158 family)